MTTKTLGQISFCAYHEKLDEQYGTGRCEWEDANPPEHERHEAAAQAVAAEVLAEQAERVAKLEVDVVRYRDERERDNFRAQDHIAKLGQSRDYWKRKAKHGEDTEREAVVQAALEFFEAYYAPPTDADSGAYLRRVAAWEDLKEAIAALRARREVKP
jgi:hypothetical protein